MTSFHPEELTLEEIKLYYKKRRAEKEFMETKRASALRHQQSKRIDKMIANGEIDIETHQHIEKPPNETVKSTKPRKYKGETIKIITVEE